MTNVASLNKVFIEQGTLYETVWESSIFMSDIDPEQAYFWTSKWQAWEKEADEDLKEGRYFIANNIEELLEELHSPEEDKN